MGFSWRQTRSYANILDSNYDGTEQGAHWFASALPYLVFTTQSGVGATIGWIRGAQSAVWFEENGAGGWIGRFGSRVQLRHDTVNRQYVVIPSSGRRYVFHSDDISLPQSLRGKLKGMENAYGARGEVIYNENDEISSIRWFDAQGSSVAFRYSYVEAPTLLGYLESVTLEVDGRPVRRARYAYAAVSSTVATTGDLQLATVEQWQGTAWKILAEEAYQYYVSGEIGGFVHGLKRVFSPESVAALRRAGLNPLTLSGDASASYANLAFTYDDEQRVVEERIQGGAHAYTYTWLAASPEPAYADVNAWFRQCIETTPDGNQNIVYTNRGGAELLKIHRNSVTTETWATYNQFDTDYKVVLRAWPSAIGSISEPSSQSDPLEVDLKASEGLVRTTEYYDADDFPNGAVKGYRKSRSVQEGASGSPILISETAYSTHTVGLVSVHPMWKQWSYPVAGASRSEAALTVYDREYFEDEFHEPTFQIAELTVTPPLVDVSMHGTGLAEPFTEVYDVEGRLTWFRNARGFITFHAYHPATGALLRTINDVDISLMTGAPSGWVTPESGGRHLITDYVSDSLGRILKALYPWIQVDPATVEASGSEALTVRPLDYSLYLDVEHEVWSARGWMTGEEEGASWHVQGPVQVLRRDFNGNVTDQIAAIPGCPCGPLGPDTFGKSGATAPRPAWTRWTQILQDLWGRQIETRIYHAIPASGSGLEGVNYSATRYGYDAMNHPCREVSPGGTVNRTVFDSRSLPIAKWVGTNDAGATSSDPTGGGTPGNNMKPTWTGIYDNGLAGGNGNLTSQSQPVNDDVADDRVTLMAYDYRNRLTTVTNNDGATDYFQVTGYDNLDRVVDENRYHTSIANLTHCSTTEHDLRGRVFNRQRYYVNSNGTLGDPLVAGTWYDPESNPIKQTQQGRLAVTKTVFDSLNRREAQYLVSEAAPTVGVNTNSVALDVVIEEGLNLYNDDNQVIAIIAKARFDDATGTGPLQGPTEEQPRSRNTFVAYYADPAGRLRYTANYGTNGGAPWQRPELHPAPSDLILVSEERYALDGGVNYHLDAEGAATAEVRDQAGRRIRLVENSSIQGADAGQTGTGSRTTDFEYAPDGGLQRLILRNPLTGDQVTTWTYGTTLADSEIASSRLPVAKTYPTGETETQQYNRQSEISDFQDCNGTRHHYRRDKLGRTTDDAVTALATGVDGLVRRISTTYDERGRVRYLTSSDNPDPLLGDVINQVEMQYNGIDCLTADIQSHAGVVNGSTPKVQYQCTAAQDHQLRRTGIIYPDGRALNYEYGAEASINDVLNRVASVHDDDLTVLAEFQYLGSAMPAVTLLPEPGVQRRWKKLASEPVGDGGDPYTGYDRFGRIEQMRWYKVESETYNPLVSVQWGYNRASLKTWRRDLLAPAATGQDQYFDYDGLHQVTERQRGVLNINATSVGGTPAQQENFHYDETGNWVTYQQANEGALDIDQTRQNNASNQISQIDGSSAGVSYDLNGNMLLVPTGESLEGPSRQLVWDAWNRLRIVKDHEDNVLGDYQYDGQTRRTLSEANEKVRHFYYNDQWRSVEERIDSETTPNRQYVWQPADRRELISRDRSKAGDGMLNERLYSLKDQLDPVALVDEKGEVLERYAYSAFGLVSVLDAEYEPMVVSAVVWSFLFHGEFWDEETSLYNYGFRFCALELGRWLSRDPLEEGGGVNLFELFNNNAPNRLDSYGLTVYQAETICFNKPSTLAFDGDGWKMTNSYPVDTQSSWYASFDFTAEATWEASVTVECECSCYTEGSTTATTWTKSASGKRTVTKEFDVMATRFDPMAGASAIALPSGANLGQQAGNAANAAGSSGLSAIAPALKQQINNAAELVAPKEPNEGSWIGGDPCKK